jgi:hypothetical protein
MNQTFVCPLCQDRRVSFSGMTASLIVRSTSESVAIFICGNSHVFTMLLSDAAPHLGIEGSQTRRWRAVRTTIARAKYETERCKAFLRGDSLPVDHPEPPKGWRELQRRALREKDPERLAVLINRMNTMLAEHERQNSEGEDASPPDTLLRCS